MDTISRRLARLETSAKRDAPLDLAAALEAGRRRVADEIRAFGLGEATRRLLARTEVGIEKMELAAAARRLTAIEQRILNGSRRAFTV